MTTLDTFLAANTALIVTGLVVLLACTYWKRWSDWTSWPKMVSPKATASCFRDSMFRLRERIQEEIQR